MKLFIILLFAALPTRAQFSDDFNDDDLLNGPVWNQLTSEYVIENGELKSASQIANHTFQIHTASTMALGEWHFNVRLNFATSGSNYSDIFLISNNTNFSAAQTTGYFVRVGGTDDEISLFRKDDNGVDKIIDGENNFVRPNVNYKMKVVRSNNHRWVLMCTVNNVDEYVGTTIDNTYTTSVAFGFLVKQSTASFFERHFFDDVLLQTHTPDITPPSITSVFALNATQLEVTFNEPVLLNGYLPSLFYVDQIGFPIQVDRNGSKLMLTFVNSFPQQTNLRLTVNEVSDLWNNMAFNLTSDFYFFTPSFGDVVIYEIFADPDPPMLLPQVEWIEIRNTTPFPISIGGWKFCKPTGCSAVFPNSILPADSLLILTSVNNDTILRFYGETIAVTAFPGLGNAGDEIWLEREDGYVMHAVAYMDEWYENPLKRIGGWSLEMIDPLKACSGKVNWRASEQYEGATPGRYNSINGLIVDDVAPTLLGSYMLDSVTIQLKFSKMLLPTSLSNTTFRFRENLLQVAEAELIAPMHHTVLLKLAQPAALQQIYYVEIVGLTDCSGNTFQSGEIAVALANAPLSGDVIINEILFNPTPSGTDFIELYNRSDQVIDLKQLYLANTNATGVTSNITVIHPEGFAFFPKTFVVISKDKKIVQSEYVFENPEKFVDLPNMPAYNDNTGKVILLNQSGDLIDDVAYEENWHYTLLTNVEGVSLERIHYDGFSNFKEYWHSAARSVGYGTPGYKNSQLLNQNTTNSTIHFSTNIISPDNDGRDDFLSIEFNFLENGNLSNIIIFDLNGRAVRILHKNILNGTSGRWLWDGLGNQQKYLPSGRYIVLVEVFNPQGKYETFKKVISVVKTKY